MNPSLINNVLLIIKINKQMQKTIQQHTNPMRHKRPFIKKSVNTNTSILSKPNLSITKASHRFSLDNTFTCTDPRHQSYLKTARNHQQHSIASPQMFVQEQNSFTQRLSLRPENSQRYKESSRRYSFRNDKRVSHKQKLQQILQSIDLNNSIIQELFEQDQQISHFKQQINKSFDFLQDLHQSLKIKAENKQKVNISLNHQISLSTRIKDIESKRLLNKVEQLRKKRLSFIENEKSQSGVVQVTEGIANT